MIEEYILRQHGKTITIQIRRSARKTAALEVKSSGEVLARVPVGLQDQETEAFIQRHRAWIVKKVELAAA